MIPAILIALSAIAAPMQLQACSDYLANLRREHGWTRADVIAYVVHMRCAIERREPWDTTVSIAGDVDGDMDIDLLDFAAAQVALSGGDCMDRARFALNWAAFRREDQGR